MWGGGLGGGSSPHVMEGLGEQPFQCKPNKCVNFRTVLIGESRALNNLSIFQSRVVCLNMFQADVLSQYCLLKTSLILISSTETLLG